MEQLRALIMWLWFRPSQCCGVRLPLQFIQNFDVGSCPTFFVTGTAFISERKIIFFLDL
jgi:hypothetical protein